nr:DNA-directed DNA polymerase [Tanacetum cinerariifolium]
MTSGREFTPPPGFSEIPITTTMFAATTPENTPIAYHASTSTNPNLVISPAFVEANYEAIESLLRDRRRQMRNNDLRTELEYFSEDYNEEREMEPRPEPTRATTPPLRVASPRIRRRGERTVGLKGAQSRGESTVERNTEGGKPLPTHLGRGENGQPLQSSLTFSYGDIPLKTLPEYGGAVRKQISGLHEEQRISSFVHGLRTRSLVEHLSTDLPSTYKGLTKKTYTWVEAREVSTNGASSDRRDNFERSNKSSQDNNRGKKNNDRFSPYRGPNHGLLPSLSKSQKDILVTAKAARSFEPPLRMFGRIKKERTKSFDTTRGKSKKDKGTAPAEAPILLVCQEAHITKILAQENTDYEGKEIICPLVAKVNNTPVIIEAMIFGRMVRRVYMDSGSSCEIIYEHRFEKLNPTIKATIMDLKTPLVGFSRERSWSIGRTTMQRMGIVVLSIHVAIKFHTKKGIGTVLSANKNDEGTKRARKILATNEEWVLSCVNSEENIIVDDKYPDQTAWDRYKDLLRACPHHGFTELHQLDTFYNALNSADQDSLNSAAGGNLLERRTQDVLTIIEKNLSAVTTAMTAILKKFQANPPSAFVKSVEEIYVTCGGAHPYYQCLAAGGNTFPELRDNIQGYVAAAAVNYNQVVPLSKLENVNRVNEANMKFMQTQINNVKNELRNEMKNSIQVSMSNQTNELKNMMASFFQMNTASTSGSGHLPSNTIANPKGELKAITTRSGVVLDGPFVAIPLPFINPEEDERVEETLMDQDLAEYTIKVPPPLLHINITLANALILIPKYQKMLKALLSNKEKLLELENTPLNDNCSTVILKKLPEKLRDPGKFLIPCSFSELKCKALADLANRAICTPAGIARDVFVSVGKFTFPADFAIFDYESDPRVSFILGRSFLRTTRALIDVHGEEIILYDGDERLTLNMRHDTSRYSNQPQKESINMINIYDDSSKDFLKDLFTTNHQSGKPTFSSHPNLTLPKVKDDIFDPEGGNVLTEKLIALDSTKDLHPPHNVNPLSGSTTSSSPNHLLEEFVDKLALITFPPGNDDLPFGIESDLKEIKYLLHHDPIKDMDSILEDSIDQSNLADLNDNLADTMPQMFTEEHALDHTSPPLYDEYDDDLFEVESDTEYVYDDPFDSKVEKIKESKLLIDKLDLPSDFLLSSAYDSFPFKDFFEVDALPSTNNEDKVFNSGILIREYLLEVITSVAPDKNVKKLAISHASLILKDFDPPLYELPFSKEVFDVETPLSFSFENEEKVFKAGILTSKGVHSSLIPELSHQGYKVFKIIKILKSPMEIFLFSRGEDIHILDVPCLHFYPP